MYTAIKASLGGVGDGRCHYFDGIEPFFGRQDTRPCERKVLASSLACLLAVSIRVHSSCLRARARLGHWAGCRGAGGGRKEASQIQTVEAIA